MKDQLEAYFNSWKGIYAQEFDELREEKACKILDSVLQYTVAEDYTDKLPEFVQFTKYLDKARGQNIVDVVPRYREFFNE